MVRSRHARYGQRMMLTIADIVVLAVLLRGGPMHGYEVWQRLTESDVHDWTSVSRAQVYYSLRKLAKTPYLEHTNGEEPSKGPERTTVRVTPLAAVAIGEELRKSYWIQRDPPSPFVTWSALAGNAEQEEAEHQIEQRKATLRAEITREETTLEVLGSIVGKDAAIGRALVRIAIARMSAELDALDGLVQALRMSEFALNA